MAEPRLKQFMEMMKLEIESGEEGSLQIDIEAGPDVVRVMTVHGAKGLEFKYVFIINLVHLRFPTSERSELIELPDDLIKEVLPEGDIHLQEERRLFYVAMTRAKEGLYFTSAEDYGGQRKKKLSQFLVELGYTPTPSGLAGARPSPPSSSAKASADRRVGGEILDVKVAVKKEKSVEKLPLPKKFPYSQISSFEKCPLQYKYAYIFKIPVFGKPSFSFGSTIHLTLQKFFERMVKGGGGQVTLFGKAEKKEKEIKIPKLEELLELYEANWIDAWYPNNKIKKEYKDKGKKILKEYYQVIKKTKPEPVRLESPFVIKVGKYNVSGRVDRIDKINNGVEIIDYKTGQAKKTVDNVDRDQLLIYQLASEECFKLKPEKLTYYYIEASKPVSFLGSEKDKEEIKNKIIKTVDKIQESEFSPTPGWVCKYCDYREICPYRAE